MQTITAKKLFAYLHISITRHLGGGSIACTKHVTCDIGALHLMSAIGQRSIGRRIIDNVFTCCCADIHICATVNLGTITSAVDVVDGTHLLTGLELWHEYLKGDVFCLPDSVAIIVC